LKNRCSNAVGAALNEDSSELGVRSSEKARRGGPLRPPIKFVGVALRGHPSREVGTEGFLLEIGID
jgi:hypothetical protein